MTTAKTGDAQTIKGARKNPKTKTIKKAAPIIIRFSATIGMIRINTRNTMIGLALSASESKQIARLMESKAPNKYLDVTAVVKEKVKDGKKKDSKRRNRRRERVSPYKRRDQ